MKKLLIIVLLSLMVFSTLSADTTYRLIVADLDQHPGILVGFLPTYLLAGFGMDFNIQENNRSELQFLFGAGYTQRMVFIDPVNEVSEYTLDEKDWGITYDVFQADLFIRYEQGFLDDLLTLRAGLETQYEWNRDSMRSEIDSLSSQLTGGDPDIYPDLQGNGHFLGSALVLRLTYDDMTDTLFTNDGILAYVEAKVAPGFLNSWLDGTANYYSLTANAVFSKTLYTYSTENMDWLSIVLIDRVNVNWTDGSVPVNAQGPVSLGRKVRGYNTYSYGTEFSAVNNLDVRLTGPSLYFYGLRPRVNLFFDMGLGAGNYYNTQIKPEKGVNFLASVGGQITISIFDFIDLGYEMAYIFTGEKMTNKGSRFSTTFTFFLDF